jgi:hypothetical protein
MQDLHTDHHDLQTVRKLFLHIEMPAFSDSHVYVILCKKSHNDCKKTKVVLSGLMIPLTEVTDRTLRNSHLNIDISETGHLKKYTNFGSNTEVNVSESFDAYKTRGNTR